MKITKPKRGRRASKRLDLTDMRALFFDRRMWSAVGIVTKFEGEAAHYEQVDGPDDYLVDVILQPSLIPVSCRVAAGVWWIPAEGEEVAVLIPEGKTEFMPTIVALLSSDAIPSAQPPTPTRIAIVRGEVVVHTGNGGAVSLALKQDVINVDNKYDGHRHIAKGDPTSTPLASGISTIAAPLPGAGAIENPPNPLYPATDPINPYLLPPAMTPTTDHYREGAGLGEALITGTTCLFAK